MFLYSVHTVVIAVSAYSSTSFFIVVAAYSVSIVVSYSVSIVVPYSDSIVVDVSAFTIYQPLLYTGLSGNWENLMEPGRKITVACGQTIRNLSKIRYSKL